jgi:hypothetical protein
MVLTADDIASISRIVAATIANMPIPAASPVAAKVRSIEERYDCKIQKFGGSNWKDFAFQSQAATRSSSEAALEIICWGELEAKPEIYDNLAEEDSIRISGELFNILTASLTGEPFMMLYNWDFNGLEAWRGLSERYSRQPRYGQCN